MAHHAAPFSPPSSELEVAASRYALLPISRFAQLSSSRHGEVVYRGVSSGYVMIELSFDVGQQSRGAETKEIRLRPFDTQFLFHQDEPEESVFRRADATRGLESHFETGPLEVLSDSSAHDDADGKDGVDAFFSRRRFDEVGASHHTHH